VLTSRDGQKAIRIKPSGISADEYERQKAENPSAIIERDTPKPVAREEPVAEPTPEKPIEVVKPSVTPPAKPEEPVAVKTEEPKPAVETAKPKGKFTIQVGSYQSSDEATASLANWKKKGYSAFMAVGTVPNKGTWYRVRIGGFPNREEAQKFLEKFKTKEKASALVVLTNS
jgi:cell division septation protein DedD